MSLALNSILSRRTFVAHVSESEKNLIEGFDFFELPRWSFLFVG